MNDLYWNTNIHRLGLSRDWNGDCRLPAGISLGRPRATICYTVEQLEAMGAVGVYVDKPNKIRKIFYL